MGISFVAGSAASNHTTGPAFNVTFGTAVQAGDLLIVKIAQGPQANTFTVTDNASPHLTWNLAIIIHSATTNSAGAIFYAVAPAAIASLTVTITPNTTLDGGDCCVTIYRGFERIPYVNGTVTNSGTGVTGSATLTASNPTGVIIVGADVASSVSSMGGGATNRITDPTGGDALGDLIFTTSGAYTPTATQAASGVWDVFLALFAPARDTVFFDQS